MRGTASLRALLIGLLALPSATAAGEVEPEREIIRLVPERGSPETTITVSLLDGVRAGIVR